MDGYLRQCLFCFSISIATGMVLSIVYGDSFIVIFPFWILLGFLAFVSVWVKGIYRAAKCGDLGQSWYYVTAAPLALSFSVVVIYLCFPYGDVLRGYFALAINKPELDSRVYNHMREPNYTEHFNGRDLTEIYWGSAMDYGRSVVFDPKDKLADDLKKLSNKDSPILFGGEFPHCRRLIARYYDCSVYVP